MSTETQPPLSPARHAAHIAPAQVGRRATAPAPRLTSDTGPITWDNPTGSTPVVGTPQPRMRQLMGVCGWAAVLGGLGLVIGIRGFIGDLMGLAPGWYEPSMIVIGIVGIGLTVGAFVTVHRRGLPYLLLGAASLVLILALGLTASAF